MIKNLSPDQFASELQKVLVKIGVMYGIRNTPDQVTVSVIQSTLLQHYRTYTLSEIFQAASLNLIGEFETKVETYQQLDLVFITGILKQYQLRKMKAFKAFRDLCLTQVPTDTQKPATGQESYAGLKDFVDKYGELPIGWDWSGVFEYMWKEKLITDSYEKLKDWFAKESARLIESLEMKLKTASSLIERREIELLMLPDAIKAECRKIYVCQMFAPIIKSEPENVEVRNPGDIGQMAIDWNREYEKGRDAEGFINYKGYDLDRESFIQTKINENAI